MNKDLFGSQAMRARKVPADVINNEGGKAYALSAKEALASMAATGCLNNSFYVRGEDQLELVMKLAEGVDTEFVAKVAVYARQRGKMKDMPTVLMAWLSVMDLHLFRKAFPLVINNGKMIRNFVQVMRSGTVRARTSLGTVPRNMVRQWFNTTDPNTIFRNSAGNNPSFNDIIRMVHPKPATAEHDALYAYLIGKPYNRRDLPEVVAQYEDFKLHKEKEAVPDLPFEFLAALNLTENQWKHLAVTARWNTLRMNLNTFARHGVFTDKRVVSLIAKRLANPEEVRISKVFPYQLLSAYLATRFNNEVPREITNALQDAMEIATENIPTLPGNVYVAVDISGSMRGAVTGDRGSATTAVSCVEVASLMAASILRKNPNALVIPFANHARPDIQLNPRDSIATNTTTISRNVGGGTACQAVLEYLNMNLKDNAQNDVIIMISDNESWFDMGGDNPRLKSGWSNPTLTKEQWEIFKRRRKNAKMICVDLAPGITTQAPTDKSVMNIGGFSDAVFDVIAGFVEAKDGASFWVKQIESIKL